MGKKKNAKAIILNKVKDIAGSYFKGDLEAYIDKLHDKTCKEQRRVAYHEAGHVVAFYNLRRRFGYATIIPKDDYWGCVMPLSFTKNFINIQNAAIYLSGYIAEYKKYDRANLGGTDLEMVNEIVSSLTNKKNMQLLFLQQLAEFTINVLESPGSWEAVEAVAQALFENKWMDSDSLKKIIKQAKRKAKRNCAG